MLLYKKHLFKEELTHFEQYKQNKKFLISIRKYQQKSILMEVKK